MVIDPRRKRFVMNMHFRQCFARAKPIRLKIIQKNPDFSGFFYFQKKLKVFKKVFRISKSVFKKPNWQPCYTRIENARKVRKKTFNFLLCIEVQYFLLCIKSRKLSFPFHLLRYYEMPECFYVKNCCF